MLRFFARPYSWNDVGSPLWNLFSQEPTDIGKTLLKTICLRYVPSLLQINLVWMESSSACLLFFFFFSHVTTNSVFGGFIKYNKAARTGGCEQQMNLLVPIGHARDGQGWSVVWNSQLISCFAYTFPSQPLLKLQLLRFTNLYNPSSLSSFYLSDHQWLSLVPKKVVPGVFSPSSAWQNVHR